MVIIIILWAICIVAGIFVSLSYEREDDDCINYVACVLLGPVALLYYSVMAWSEYAGGYICETNCPICKEDAKLNKYGACSKCTIKNNITHKEEVRYYVKEREIEDRIKKEEVNARIKVLESLKEGEFNDAKNKKTFLD